jgi:hypothetical protein
MVYSDAAPPTLCERETHAIHGAWQGVRCSTLLALSLRILNSPEIQAWTEPRGTHGLVSPGVHTARRDAYPVWCEGERRNMPKDTFFQSTVPSAGVPVECRSTVVVRCVHAPVPAVCSGWRREAGCGGVGTGELERTVQVERGGGVCASTGHVMAREGSLCGKGSSSHVEDGTRTTSLEPMPYASNAANRMPTTKMCTYWFLSSVRYSA